MWVENQWNFSPLDLLNQLISLIKGFLLNSIPTFLAVSFFSFTFYLPLHFLKNQSTFEVKQTVSTEKFIITQNVLDEIVSSTQRDTLLLPPKDFRIIEAP